MKYRLCTENLLWKSSCCRSVCGAWTWSIFFLLERRSLRSRADYVNPSLITPASSLRRAERRRRKWNLRFTSFVFFAATEPLKWRGRQYPDAGSSWHCALLLLLLLPALQKLKMLLQSLMNKHFRNRKIIRSDLLTGFSLLACSLLGAVDLCCP